MRDRIRARFAMVARNLAAGIKAIHDPGRNRQGRDGHEHGEIAGVPHELVRAFSVDMMAALCLKPDDRSKERIHEHDPSLEQTAGDKCDSGRRGAGTSRPKCNRPAANAATVKVRRKKKPAAKRGRAEPPRASCEFWLDSIAYFLPAGRRLGPAALLPAFLLPFSFSVKNALMKWPTNRKPVAKSWNAFLRGVPADRLDRHPTTLQFYRLQFDWTLANSVQPRRRRSKIQDGIGIGASWPCAFAPVTSLPLSSWNQSCSPTRCRTSFSHALGSVP